MSDGRIVLMEDNPDDVLLTVMAFARSGVDDEIVVLPDGDQGVAALLPPRGEPRVAPALVLLDVNLPGIGGLEVLRRIRADERTSTVPVVMLSTSREPRDIRASYRLGANSFVRKPLSFTRFEAAVRTLASYWLEVNEPCPPAGQP
jgi:two-component system response regulator